MKTCLALALLAAPALASADASVPDPVTTHTLTVEDATKGLKGTGSLLAKIDVEQSGKPFGSFTCELFEKQAPKTVANFVGLARGVRVRSSTRPRSRGIRRTSTTGSSFTV